MKKLVLTTMLIAASASVAMEYYNSRNKAEASVIEMANVEALSKKEGTGNTGPGEIYDCPWWFTGDGKYCLCKNEYDCTETPC